MPTYYSLAQQGFYEPYKHLQSGINDYVQGKRYADERKRQAELDKRQVEQEKLAAQESQNRIAAQKLEFENATRKSGQAKAIEKLNFRDPVQMPSAPLPEGMSGPTLPPVNMQFDLQKPWHEQQPELRQNVVGQLAPVGVQEPLIAELYNQTVTAATGRPVLPQAPEGMKLSGFQAGGATYDKAWAPNGGAPKLLDMPETGGAFKWDPVNNRVVEMPKVMRPGADLSMQPVSGPNGEVMAEYVRDPISGEVKNVPPAKDDRGERDFLSSAKTLKELLPQARALVKDFGLKENQYWPNALSSTGENSDVLSNVAQGKLKTKLTQISQQMSKFLDPETAAMQGEVNMWLKLLDGMGYTTPNDVAASNLEALEQFLDSKINNFVAIRKSRTGMPSAEANLMKAHLQTADEIMKKQYNKYSSEPGSSYKNPVSVSSLEEAQQHAGKWVRNPDGQIVQVPRGRKR